MERKPNSVLDGLPLLALVLFLLVVVLVVAWMPEPYIEPTHVPRRVAAETPTTLDLSSAELRRYLQDRIDAEVAAEEMMRRAVEGRP